VQGNSFQRHVKLQKLLYHLESRLFNDRIKALNYTFYKWQHGPFSKFVYSDVDALEKTDMIIVRDVSEFYGEFYLTERGLELIDNLNEIINDYDELNRYTIRVINEFGEYDWYDLKHITYAYPSPLTRIPIKKLNKGDLILPKLEISEATKIITINEAWRDTLGFILEPELYEKIISSIKLARSDSEGKSLEELFKDVI
jgi:uncharacterized phage-associated protein